MADGASISYDYESPVTSDALSLLKGDGVNKVVQNSGLELHKNASYPSNYNFDEPDRVDYMPGVIDTTLLAPASKATVQGLTIQGFVVIKIKMATAYRYDGLIYLEKGTYSFSAKNANGMVTADETVMLNIGGQRVLENNDWNHSWI